MAFNHYFSVAVFVHLGILPLDSDSSGCASQCVACEFEIGRYCIIF